MNTHLADAIAKNTTLKPNPFKNGPRPQLSDSCGNQRELVWNLYIADKVGFVSIVDESWRSSKQDRPFEIFAVWEYRGDLCWKSSSVKSVDPTLAKMIAQLEES